MTPGVSVIIPTRNRLSLLKRALQSIKMQTFTPLEVIVVDDASDQDIFRALGDFPIESLRFIRMEKRSGGAVCRNRGINEAKGEYVAFLDDDDEWMPEKLQKQVNCFREYSLTESGKMGLCYTGRRTVRRGWGFYKRYSFMACPEEKQARQIMKDNFIGITSSVMVPRNILLEIGGFDQKLPCFQDYDLYIRILKKYFALGINEPLVYYHLGESASHVSFGGENVSVATEYMMAKYASDEGAETLRRALRRINFKKMLKSLSYARESVLPSIKSKK